MVVQPLFSFFYRQPRVKGPSPTIESPMSPSGAKMLARERGCCALAVQRRQRRKNGRRRLVRMRKNTCAGWTLSSWGEAEEPVPFGYAQGRLGANSKESGPRRREFSHARQTFATLRMTDRARKLTQLRISKKVRTQEPRTK